MTSATDSDAWLLRVCQVCSVKETPKALSSSERARELRRVAMQQCLSLSLLMLFTVCLFIALVGVIFYVFGLGE